MRYTGKLLEGEGLDDARAVSEAVVTKTRIAVDWDNSEDKGHIHATSTDGVHYEGNVGFPRPEAALVLKLQRYESGDDLLFFGTFHDRDQGDEGTLIICLTPEAYRSPR